MQQSPSSTLTITGADILATGNVTVTATTNSQLRLRTDSLWIGVNYGRSDATATLTVAGGARIVAGAAVQLATNITNSCASGPSSHRHQRPPDLRHEGGRRQGWPAARSGADRGRR